VPHVIDVITAVRGDRPGPLGGCVGSCERSAPALDRPVLGGAVNEHDDE
jgi:hypothetical protein